MPRDTHPTDRDDAPSHLHEVPPEGLEDLEADDAYEDDLDRPAREDDDEEMDILVDLYDDDLDSMEGPDA